MQQGRGVVGVQQIMCPDCEGEGERLKEKDRFVHLLLCYILV